MLKKLFVGLLLMMFFTFLYTLESYASQKVYLDDSTEFPGVSTDLLFSLRSNLTFNDNFNHSFDGKSTSNGANWDIEYISSNATGFLLKFRVDDVGIGGAINDKISTIDCANLINPINDVCGPNCGGLDFSQYHTFNVLFNFTSFTAHILIDGNNLISCVPLCTNSTQIGSIRFSRTRFSKNNRIIVFQGKPIKENQGRILHINTKQNSFVGS